MSELPNVIPPQLTLISGGTVSVSQAVSQSVDCVAVVPPLLLLLLPVLSERDRVLVS